MTTTSIFLDESGDLGWTLSKPRLQGGSSRFIVLAAITVPSGLNKHIERIITGFYKSRGRPHSNELKSTALNGHERKSFAKALTKLKEKHSAFSFHAVVAEKSNVIHALSNKTEVLYTHMAEQMLHQTIALYPSVDFYPDARTVKPKDKNALHNYLETRLAIAGHTVDIRTHPSESGSHKEIQAADILASIVWAKYEENSTLFDDELINTVTLTKLF